MANVLITGVTGFIGSHLARKLVEKGHNVYGMVRQTPGRDYTHMQDLMGKIVLVPADFTNYQSVTGALKSVMPDYVFHLGALTPVRLSFERPFEYLQNNYVGTVNMIHALLELPDFKKRRFLMASTAEVYGWQSSDKPTPETVALHPSSPYAVAKAATDLYARMAMRVYDLNATVLRCTNTYGRKSPTDKLYIVENYITLMLENKPTYMPTPKSAREYMYVDDHVNAYFQCMDNPAAEKEVFNGSTGSLVTNEQLHAAVAKLTGYKQKPVMGQSPPGYPQRQAQHENDIIWLDNTKLKEKIGWKPSVTLEQGLQKSIDFWKTVLK